MKTSAEKPADGSTVTVDVSDSSTSNSPSNTPKKGGIVLEFEGFGGGKTRTPAFFRTLPTLLLCRES